MGFETFDLRLGRQHRRLGLLDLSGSLANDGLLLLDLDLHLRGVKDGQYIVLAYRIADIDVPLADVAGDLGEKRGFLECLDIEAGLLDQVADRLAFGSNDPDG